VFFPDAKVLDCRQKKQIFIFIRTFLYKSPVQSHKHFLYKTDKQHKNPHSITDTGQNSNAVDCPTAVPDEPCFWSTACTVSSTDAFAEERHPEQNRP
jgi:hypothetical protein